ncbi:MAG: type IV pilus twitching motility protein PilT [Fusobacteriaceae bacterium]
MFKELDMEKVSDIHLITGIKPAIRHEGSLKLLENFETLKEEDIKKIALNTINEKKEKDFVLEILGTRIRCNFYYEKNKAALALRVLKEKIPLLENLELTKEICEILKKESGMILVTGATGSGKSTTLASIVEYLNINCNKRIITLEDPIEYLYISKNSIITQREVGKDTESFESGIRSALRQDPDIILVGELRDKESLEQALIASETGHLVLATLHSKNSREALNRIVNFFQKEKQDSVKTSLSESLKAVISQELIKTTKGERKAIFEILIVNRGVKNLIQKGESNQIYSMIEIGGKFGMRTKETSLKKLLEKKLITIEEYKDYLPREEI